MKLLYILELVFSILLVGWEWGIVLFIWLGSITALIKYLLHLGYGENKRQ